MKSFHHKLTLKDCFKRSVLVVTLLVCFAAQGQTEESIKEKGRAIAFKAEEIFDHYGDMTVDVVMHLKKPNQDVISRKMIMKILQTDEDTDKVIMQFLSPADVKGLAFLMSTHKDKFDDFWIYIPDLRRVKRISSQTKGSEFMGSEFQTEDLIRAEPDKYSYKWLEDKPCGELECHLVDRYPKEKSSIYSRQVIWVDKDHFRFQQIDSYDKSGNLVKTLEYYNYTLHKGKFWRWGEHKLTDHRTGEITRSEFKNWKFNIGLKKNEFTANGLKNIR